MLQLYEREIIWNDTAEILEEGEEDHMQEAYTKEENYGWKPVGKPFRVTITHAGDDK